ncbi:molybdenum cofactor guanylyltransferase [Geovibrio thiophilus]|nr:molybdenum cofactor guanylyltransferase [Geovibrio thiophilus]
MLLNVALLAGGQSRRFGSDKALALFRGKPLIEYISEKFVREGFNVSVISKDVTKYLNVLSGSVEHVEDIYEQQCPLAGIITALRHFRSPVFVISTDAPAVPAGAVKAVLSALEGYDAAVPDAFGKIHPLIAAYSPSCLDVLMKQFETGNFRLRDALSSLNTRYLDDSFFCGLGFDSSMFSNINRREDMEILNNTVSGR